MKQRIETNRAPKPVGPYSQAVVSGSAIYISGQIGLDPESGELQNDSIQQETEQVLANLKAILEEVDVSMEAIVRVEIFMTDLAQFGAVNSLYEMWLGNVSVLPARQTVGVAALPLGAQVEISCIAELNEAN